MRASESHRDPKALSTSDGEIRTEFARRLQQQQRQKMFEDTGKRKSEHNVMEATSKWVDDDS